MCKINALAVTLFFFSLYMYNVCVCVCVCLCMRVIKAHCHSRISHFSPHTFCVSQQHTHDICVYWTLTFSFLNLPFHPNLSLLSDLLIILVLADLPLVKSDHLLNWVNSYPTTDSETYWRVKNIIHSCLWNISVSHSVFRSPWYKCRFSSLPTWIIPVCL